MVRSFSTSIAIIYTKTACNDINIELFPHPHVNREFQQQFEYLMLVDNIGALFMLLILCSNKCFRYQYNGSNYICPFTIRLVQICGVSLRLYIGLPYLQIVVYWSNDHTVTICQYILIVQYFEPQYRVDGLEFISRLLSRVFTDICILGLVQKQTRESSKNEKEQGIAGGEK